MKYHCDICNYSTEFSSNWCRHNKTKNHIEKINKRTDKKLTTPENTPEHLTAPNNNNNEKNTSHIICNLCNVTFTRSSSLLRHYNVCKEKSKINNNEKIRDLEKEKNDIQMLNQIKLLEEKLKYVENERDLFKKENEFHKSLVVSAGNLISSSMSTLNHLILNYDNAPILKPIEDYSLLEDKKKFIDNIIYHYNENRLDQYLGNFLVKHYKTKDPKTRSNWISDTSRLTYINRELVNNRPNWVIDKKGVKMSGIIIEPFLEYIKSLSQNEINKLKENISEIPGRSLDKQIFYKMASLSEIIKNINNKCLSKNINRYLAPHFYFDKNNILVVKGKE